MQYRRLGASGPMVSAIGLGCMGMSDGYGPPRLEDRAESIVTIQAALDAGINLLDTGDFYGSGHNELLVGEALKGRRRDLAILSVKFGVVTGDGIWKDSSARRQDAEKLAPRSESSVKSGGGRRCGSLRHTLRQPDRRSYR
jgi:aryl-alcohol dehydrogenase-like predicted oxidoreductase